MNSYKDLRVYQLAKEVDNYIFQLIQKFPKDESREHLSAALYRKYFLKEDFDSVDDKLDHLGRMLTLLIKKVRLNEKR